MPVILDDLPFADAPYDLALPGGGTIRIASRQIGFWASVTRRGLTALPPNAPRIPLVFDSGFNSGFIIQMAQYMRWCWLPVDLRVNKSLPAYLHADGKGIVERIPRWEVNVWVYPNLPGSTALAPNTPPFCLSIPNQAMFFTPYNSRLERRLPLLGMWAIEANQLDAHIDGARSVFALAAP